MEPETYDLFRALRNACKAGLLERKPEAAYEYVPGKRYFENMVESLLKSGVPKWAERFAIAGPIIRFLAEEENWKSIEIHTPALFRALGNMYRTGLLERKPEAEYEYVPGKRYFENMKAAVLGTGIGDLAITLSTAMPIVRFLADEKNRQIIQEEE
jgi:hypothetical protein